MAKTNPDSFSTSDSDEPTPIRSRYKIKQLTGAFIHKEGLRDLQKGTEHVTLPVNTFSSFHDELC